MSSNVNIISSTVTGTSTANSNNTSNLNLHYSSHTPLENTLKSHAVGNASNSQVTHQSIVNKSNIPNGSNTCTNNKILDNNSSSNMNSNNNINTSSNKDTIILLDEKESSKNKTQVLNLSSEPYTGARHSASSINSANPSHQTVIQNTVNSSSHHHHEPEHVKLLSNKDETNLNSKVQSQTLNYDMPNDCKISNVDKLTDSNLNINTTTSKKNTSIHNNNNAMSISRQQFKTTLPTPVDQALILNHHNNKDANSINSHASNISLSNTNTCSKTANTVSNHNTPHSQISSLSKHNSIENILDDNSNICNIKIDVERPTAVKLPDNLEKMKQSLRAKPTSSAAAATQVASTQSTAATITSRNSKNNKNMITNTSQSTHNTPLNPNTNNNNNSCLSSKSNVSSDDIFLEDMRSTRVNNLIVKFSPERLDNYDLDQRFTGDVVQKN